MIGINKMRELKIVFLALKYRKGKIALAFLYDDLCAILVPKLVEKSFIDEPYKTMRLHAALDSQQLCISKKFLCQQFIIDGEPGYQWLEC